MSFNINYILPGDNKNQILEKTNYNFSQILANAPGFPGEIGIKGPTGIIGQVGKDGSSGATGLRANAWFIQENQPFGDISYTETPLINYDIWVNTSAAGPNGPNRIYRYDGNNTLGTYPFWVDTFSNFIVDVEFTQLQGVNGPGEVNEKDAIIISPNSGSSPLNTSFVFTDRIVNQSNANPNYAKVLIESDASITTSLPIFGLDKTFYSTPGLPAFYWKTTGLDYGIKFSSGEDIIIQSQATGSYGSTGGTSSVNAINLNFNSASTFEIFATGGASISAQTLGFSSLNATLGPGGVSLPRISSTVGITAASASNTLSVSGNLTEIQTGIRTLFNYSGLYGGTNQNSLNLSMGNSSLFQIGNSPLPAIGGATYPALVIGYTGSTGISGGTGANIVKSYQSITNSASSKARINGNLNNYIPVTPSSDVILINPNPTGPIISDGNRINRIWLLLTGVESYVESGNVSCIDIFMNSNSIYSFGGVLVPISLQSPGAPFTITDSGGTIPGATGGCMHIRINFFGSPFPGSLNPRTNKFFNIQSFSSGFSKASLLPYTASPDIAVPFDIGIVNPGIILGL